MQDRRVQYGRVGQHDRRRPEFFATTTDWELRHAQHKQSERREANLPCHAIDDRARYDTLSSDGARPLAGLGRSSPGPPSTPSLMRPRMTACQTNFPCGDALRASLARLRGRFADGRLRPCRYIHSTEDDAQTGLSTVSPSASGVWWQRDKAAETCFQSRGEDDRSIGVDRD